MAKRLLTALIGLIFILLGANALLSGDIGSGTVVLFAVGFIALTLLVLSLSIPDNSSGAPTYWFGYCAFYVIIMLLASVFLLNIMTLPLHEYGHFAAGTVFGGKGGITYSISGGETNMVFLSPLSLPALFLYHFMGGFVVFILLFVVWVLLRKYGWGATALLAMAIASLLYGLGEGLTLFNPAHLNPLPLVLTIFVGLFVSVLVSYKSCGKEVAQLMFQ